MYKDSFLKISSASAFICLFAYAATLCVTHACNNEINRAFGISNTLVGILYMMIYLGFIPATLYAGRIADKKGKLPVILTGCILMIVGLFLFPLTTNYYVALFAMLIMGMGGGCAETNSMSFIGDIYTGVKRQQMMNFCQTAFGLGAVAGPLIAGYYINKQMNYTSAFYTIGGLAFIGFIFTLISYLQKKEKPIFEAHKKTPWGDILRDKYVYIILLGIILYCGTELGTSSWIAVYFEKILNSTASISAGIVSLIWLGIAVGSAIFAVLAKHMKEVTMIKVAIIGVIISMLVLLTIKITIIASISVFLIGCFLGPIFATMIGLASIKYKENSGAVSSILFAGGNLGGALFPTVMGYAVDKTNIVTALYIALILSVINLIVFLPIKDQES